MNTSFKLQEWFLIISTLNLAKVKNQNCFRILDIYCFKFHVSDMCVDREMLFTVSEIYLMLSKCFTQFVLRIFMNKIAKDLLLLVSYGRRLNNIDQDK